MVGLFQFWLLAEGARKLGAEETWRDLTSAAVPEVVIAPASFQWGDEVFDATAAQQLLAPAVDNLSHVRRGEASLLGAWWRLTWEAACGAVRGRFGPERRPCERCETTVVFTMEELYRKIFLEVEVDSHSRKKELPSTTCVSLHDRGTEDRDDR